MNETNGGAQRRERFLLSAMDRLDDPEAALELAERMEGFVLGDQPLLMLEDHRREPEPAETETEAPVPAASEFPPETGKTAKRRSRRSVWTEDHSKRLKVLWADGLTGKDIAENLGVSQWLIYQKAKKLGLPDRSTGRKRKASAPAEPVARPSRFPLSSAPHGAGGDTLEDVLDWLEGEGVNVDTESATACAGAATGTATGISATTVCGTRGTSSWSRCHDRRAASDHHDGIVHRGRGDHRRPAGGGDPEDKEKIMNPAIFLSAVGAGFLLFIVGVIWLAPAPWQGGIFVTVGGLFLIAGVAAVAWGFANDGHEAYDAMVSGFFGVVMIGVAVVFALLAWWRW